MYLCETIIQYSAGSNIINKAIKFMKNLSIVLNVILLIAVCVLFVLHFSGRRSGESTEQSASEGGNTDATKIVYVNTDTLLSNYLLAIELNEAFLKKQEERRTELNIKAKSLDQEANEFQRKLQNNGFISEARAIDARDQLLVKQQNLQKLQQEMTDKMTREQNDLSKKLFEAITAYLAQYNNVNGFNIVLSTTLGGNVLYAQPGFDITNDVLKGLNEEYEKTKGAGSK